VGITVASYRSLDAVKGEAEEELTRCAGEVREGAMKTSQRHEEEKMKFVPMGKRTRWRQRSGVSTTVAGGGVKCSPFPARDPRAPAPP